MPQRLNHRPPFRAIREVCRIEDMETICGLADSIDLDEVIHEMARDAQGIRGKRLPTMDREH